MNATATTALHVQIADDKMSATLTVPAHHPVESVEVDGCVQALEAAGVKVTPEVTQACQVLVDRVREQGTQSDVSMTVARGTPPQHGRDGSIQWLTEHQAVPVASHYERCAFTMVREGDAVANIVDPTPHEDGVDVMGTVLRARTGKPVALKTDDSLQRNDRGQLIARISGALDRSTAVVRIRNVLEVPEYVDFSTGNIQFAGDVFINRGVRDRFQVRATGNIQCLGVIEGAIIECEGDLTTRGMAGRDRGSATVGRNLHARYLDNVTAVVGRNLCVEKSIINCDTTIHGALVSPNATLIGGRHIVTGVVQLHTLGSPAHVTTTLILGTVPRLDAAYAQLAQLVSQLTERHQQLGVEYELLQNFRNPASPHRERLAELHHELARCAESLHRGKSSLGRLHKRITELRTIRLVVSHLLHAGTLLQIGGEHYRLREDIRGPVAVELDGYNQPALVSGDARRVALESFCEHRGGG